MGEALRHGSNPVVSKRFRSKAAAHPVGALPAMQPEVLLEIFGERFCHGNEATSAIQRFGFRLPLKSIGMQRRRVAARTVPKLPHYPSEVTEETCPPGPSMRNRGMPIRARYGLIFFLLLSSVGLAAQEKSDAATVRALETKWTASYKDRSIDILSSLLAEDFVITIEDGNVYSKAGYITHSADTSVRVEVAELSDLKVRVHGDTAIVTGAYHERGESGGKRYEYHDRLTDVWMKMNGKWQVVSSHYSVPYKGN